MAFPVINPFFQFFDGAGEPLAGGTVETYESGASTPKVTYQDAALTTPNPTTIPLDSAGRCSMFVGDGETLKYILKDADGVEIDTQNGVKSPAGTQASIGELLYPRTVAEIAAGAVPDDYAKDPEDSRRHDSVYDLNDLGPIKLYDKTEAAQAYVDDDSFLDVTGDLTGKGTITVDTGVYDSGYSAGDIAGYYYFRLSGDGRVSLGLKFDGNGQGDYIAYQSGAVNVYFYPLVLATGAAGQKAIASHITDACGHAIEGAPSENAIIALNTGDHQNGVGVTSTVGFVSLGNSFRHGSDSHYFLNSVRGAVHVGNVGIDGVNGGGVDLVGARETACVGNSYSDNLAEGIWVLRSPNTTQTYRNVLTCGNVLRNNRNYADADKAEIATGHHDELATAQGETAAHIGNLIDVRTSVSSTDNVAFWNHPLADKTFHIANVTVGESDAANKPTAVDEGSPRSHYAFNVGCPDSSGAYSVRSTLYYAAAPASRAVYAYNVNWRIHPDSVGIPTEMESGDGFWQYHIVRELPIAGLTVMEILYEGGYTQDLIEVTVASRGDTGLIKRTVVTRGQSAATVTILDNVVDKTFGTAPPTITVTAPANAGKIVIAAAADALAPDNQLAAFFIKVISAEDYPERFVPTFA